MAPPIAVGVPLRFRERREKEEDVAPLRRVLGLQKGTRRHVRDSKERTGTSTLADHHSDLRGPICPVCPLCPFPLPFPPRGGRMGVLVLRFSVFDTGVDPPDAEPPRPHGSVPSTYGPQPSAAQDEAPAAQRLYDDTEPDSCPDPEGEEAMGAKSGVGGCPAGKGV